MCRRSKFSSSLYFQQMTLITVGSFMKCLPEQHLIFYCNLFTSIKLFSFSFPSLEYCHCSPQEQEVYQEIPSLAYQEMPFLGKIFPDVLIGKYRKSRSCLLISFLLSRNIKKYITPVQILLKEIVFQSLRGLIQSISDGLVLNDLNSNTMSGENFTFSSDINFVKCLVFRSDLIKNSDS